MTEIEEIQHELSNFIHKDIVKIITSYSEIGILNYEFLKELLIHIKLLENYNVTYLHNNELNEVMGIIKEELKNSYYPLDLTLIESINFLLGNTNNLKKSLTIQLLFKVPKELFTDCFNILNIFGGDVKGLYTMFIEYVFNTSFLNHPENIQIDCIYKAWNLSLRTFHDNEASQYAYKKLLKLFHQALHYKKTEVAFWLYYNPLHYFKSGTSNDTAISNNEFKYEVEKPIEQYIHKYILPKYNINENTTTSNSNKKRVAFIMQRIVPHSTINVFYALIKKLMKEKNENYEFILYNLSFPESGGNNQDYVDKIKQLGIQYIDVHERIFQNTSPTYPLLKKCIETRNLLINHNVDILIGLHTRIEYLFLYTTRTCPKQIYWYHSSNAQYDIKGIDLRIMHGSTLSNNSILKIGNFDFYQFPDVIDIDKTKDSTIVKVEQERKKLPKNKIILGTIGRLVKLSDEYIKTICDIMKKNKHVIYLACGSGDIEAITSKVDKEVLDHWYFTGHIDPKIYGHIIDICPNTFPVPQGLSALELMSKGKPVITLKNKFHDFNEQKKVEKKYYDSLPYPMVSLDINMYASTIEMLINMSIDERHKTGILYKTYVEKEYFEKNISKEFYNILNKRKTNE